jgi:hypothetical protein
LELAALFSLSGEGAAEFSIRIDAKAIPTAIEYLIECMISLLRGAAKSHWDRDLRIATVQQEFRSPARLFSRSDPQNSPAFHLDPTPRQFTARASQSFRLSRRSARPVKGSAKIKKSALIQGEIGDFRENAAHVHFSARV